ncbi:MAG: hypothetical protein H6Q72_4710 [Firmicutes bacterium]|nr:hypothetical protein [Bacillota bacterium]
MVECKHGWIPEGAICRDCKEADLRQQLQQAQALSDTAGAELLEKIGQLERKNKALRCCENCEYVRWLWGERECALDGKDAVECENNNHNHWVIAERLVSKE